MVSVSVIVPVHNAVSGGRLTRLLGSLKAQSLQGIEFVQAEVQQVPSNTIELDENSSEKMQRLIDNLEDLDDVMNVYHNWAE